MEIANNTVSTSTPSPAACTWSDSEISLTLWINYVVYFIVLPVYIVIGLAQNFILLIAFYKKSTTDRPYMYQVFLTFSKTFEILMFSAYQIGTNWLSGIYWFTDKGVQYSMKSYSFIFVNFVIGTLAHIHCIICSILFSVAMAGDRVFALASPIRYKNINNFRHRLTAAIICSTLPLTSSVSCAWYTKIMFNSDRYAPQTDFDYRETIVAKLCVQCGTALRFGGIVMLIALNVVIVFSYRRYMATVARITNTDEKRAAAKAADKTLTLLNFFQSLLMCVNQSMHLLSFIIADFAMCNCYTWTIADTFIFVTDSIDIFVVMAIDRKMRNIVIEVFRCGKNQTEPIVALVQNRGTQIKANDNNDDIDTMTTSFFLHACVDFFFWIYVGLVLHSKITTVKFLCPAADKFAAHG